MRMSGSFNFPGARESPESGFPRLAELLSFMHPDWPFVHEWS